MHLGMQNQAGGELGKRAADLWVPGGYRCQSGGLDRARKFDTTVTN